VQQRQGKGGWHRIPSTLANPAIGISSRDKTPQSTGDICRLFQCNNPYVSSGLYMPYVPGNTRGSVQMRRRKSNYIFVEIGKFAS